MNKPDTAHDYQDRDVRAVKSVLVELGQVLGAWRDKFVIVGGAVPLLLFGDANPRHIGTLDIDLDLDPAGAYVLAGEYNDKKFLTAKPTLPIVTRYKKARAR
jgi:hypothetical protein